MKRHIIEQQPSTERVNGDMETGERAHMSYLLIITVL